MTFILIFSLFGLMACEASGEGTDSSQSTEKTEQTIDIDSTTNEVPFTYPVEIDSLQHELVLQFIRGVQNENLKKLSKKVNYPLERENPLANIEDKKQFANYPLELFDDSLINLLLAYEENPDIIDLTGSNGKFGILNGLIWFTEDGNLESVNYLSSKEVAELSNRTLEIKSLLHSSIQEYEQNYYIGETEKFLFRIDWLDDNYTQMRYSSWSNGWNMSQKPDIILENGNYIKMGTGGGYQSSFINGDYVYVFDQVFMAETEADMGEFLILTQNNKEISRERSIAVQDELEYLESH